MKKNKNQWVNTPKNNPARAIFDGIKKHKMKYKVLSIGSHLVWRPKDFKFL